MAKHVVDIPTMNWNSGDDKAAVMQYKLRIQRCFRVNDIPKEKQSDIIVYQLGDIGEKKMKSWGLTDDEAKDPDSIWNKLEATCGIEHSFRAARVEFSNMSQGTDQTVDMFYADLKDQCDKCRFKEPDDRIIDQLIRGVQIKDAKKELVVEDEKLTLPNCLKIARKHESNEAQFNAFETSTNPSINTGVNAVKSDTRRSAYVYKDCYFCGRDHIKGKCPAYGTECSKCREFNHWARQCEIVAKYHARVGRPTTRTTRPATRDDTPEDRSKSSRRPKAKTKAIHHLTKN